MPKLVERKTKEQIAKAAASSSKGGKKKWTKGRVKDKVDNAVFFEKALYDKLLTEIVKMKVITVSTLMDKLKVNGSLARLAIRHCVEKNLIKSVTEHHHSQYILTTTAAPKKIEEKVEEKAQEKGKGKGKQQAKKAAAAAPEEAAA